MARFHVEELPAGLIGTRRVESPAIFSWPFGCMPTCPPSGVSKESEAAEFVQTKE